MKLFVATEPSVEQTASEMVLGALSRSTATVAVAVTGIAGPGGAVPVSLLGPFICLGAKKEKSLLLKDASL